MIFSAMKDAALEKALSMALRPRLERYGELQELKVDTAAKVLRARVLPLGESEPVTVSEAHYRVEEEHGTAYVVFSGIKISRPWAQNAIDDHFKEIRVKLPDFARSFL